jgi:hypothetical protein
VKNHDFTPKNHMFFNFRGPAPWIRPWHGQSYLISEVHFLRYSSVIDFLIHLNSNIFLFKSFIALKEHVCACLKPGPVFTTSHVMGLFLLRWEENTNLIKRRVWRYQKGNQNPYIEEEQTTHCFSVLFYMCNCYWYTFINVHALFHMCYICYVISRRRLHKLVKLVSYPFCLYEQIQLL